MRQNVKALLLSTVFIAAGSFASHAGGLMEPYGGLKDGGYSAPAPTFGGMGGSLKDGPMVAPAQTGWYIRGDIGYSHYGNVGGYIGESSMYVGQNGDNGMSSTGDGTFVGDFDGSCQLNANGDYQYADSAYVYETVGAGTDQVLTTAQDVADGTALAAGQPKVQVLDADGNKTFIGLDRFNADQALAEGARTYGNAVTNYTDENGDPVEADGYVYFNNAATGATIMRFNPNSQVGSYGQRIPQLDANGAYIVAAGVDPVATEAAGNPDNLIIGYAADGTPNAVYQSVQHPNVDGSGAGIWEVYNAGADKWTNVAAVYHDAAGDKKVLIWDNNATSVASQAAGGAWGDRDENGNSFVAQSMIDVVRGFAATIPAAFLKTSTNPADSRESHWLNMAAMAAGRSTCNMGRQALTSASIDDTWTIGGGVGYYFNSNWRGDLTFDHRASSDLTVTADHLDEWGVAAYTTTRTAEISSFVALANLYYDFGDRNGFTPYVGAGIGFSVNSMSGYDQDCYDNTNDMGCMKNHSGEGARDTSVAAAAMVGFTQSLGGALKLDVGYRYLYLGDAKSGNELASAAAGGQGQLVLEDLTAHELRIGIRYDFGCGTCR